MNVDLTYKRRKMISKGSFKSNKNLFKRNLLLFGKIILRIKPYTHTFSKKGELSKVNGFDTFC
jgi:hypothetical protein